MALSQNITPSPVQASANRLLQSIEAYRAVDITKYRSIKNTLRIYYQTTLGLPITPALGQDDGPFVPSALTPMLLIIPGFGAALNFTPLQAAHAFFINNHTGLILLTLAILAAVLWLARGAGHSFILRITKAVSRSIRSWAFLCLAAVFLIQASVTGGKAWGAETRPSGIESAQGQTNGSFIIGKGDAGREECTRGFQEAAVVQKIQILRQLSVSKEPWAAEFLMIVLSDTDAQVRAEATSILGWKGYTPAGEVFISALNDPDTRVRFESARALGRMGCKEAVDGLIRLLQDKDVHVRSQAILALGSIGDARAVEPIKVCFNGQDQEVQAIATWVLHTMGVPVNDLAKTLLKNPDKQARMVAEYTLERLVWNSTNIQEKLTVLLSKNDWEAIEKMGRDVVPFLLEIAGNSAGLDRGNATCALMYLKDYRAIPVFLKGLVSGDISVLMFSFAGLIAIAAKAVGGTGVMLLVLVRLAIALKRVLVRLNQGLRDRRASVSQPGVKARSTVRTIAGALLSVEAVVAVNILIAAICLLFFGAIKAFFSSIDLALIISLLPAIVLLAAYDAAKMISWFLGKFFPSVRTGGKQHFLVKWAGRIGAVLVASIITLDMLSVNLSLAASSSKKDNLPVVDFPKMQPAVRAAMRDLTSVYLSSDQKERLATTLLQLVQIRSPSGHEEDIRAFLKNTLEGLSAREIKSSPQPGSLVPLNLVMEIPATPGYEHMQTLILNAHMDTISEGCRPEGLRFNGDKNMLFHAQDMSFGADDKTGVTVIVEALRALKENYWDKGYGHRRIVVILTAREEEWGRKGAAYLGARYPGIFADAQISLTVDVDIQQWATATGRPFVIKVPPSKEAALKYKMILDAAENLSRQRGIPLVRAHDVNLLGTDAVAFPAESFRVLYFCAPYLGWHTKERVYLADLVNYTDLLAHVVHDMDSVETENGNDRLSALPDLDKTKGSAISSVPTPMPLIIPGFGAALNLAPLQAAHVLGVSPGYCRK